MTHANTRPVALRMIVGAAAVMAALLAFVPAASAARDPISGGTTDLHLKKGFLKKLTNLGVGLAGVGTGQVSGSDDQPAGHRRDVRPDQRAGPHHQPRRLPARQGRPLGGDHRRRSEHRPGLRPRERSPARTCSSAPSPPRPIGREGFGARVKAGQLTLTQKAANRISNKLGLQGSQRINQRVMSNEFNITVPSTVTHPRPERSDAGSRSRRSLKKLVEKGVDAASGIKPIAPGQKPESRPTSPSRSRAGSLATELHLGPGDDHRRRGNPEERQNLLAADEDHQHLGRIRRRRRRRSNWKSCRPPFPGQTGRSSIVELVFPANAIQTQPDDAPDHGQRRGSETAGRRPRRRSTTVFNQGDEKAPPASSEFAAGELFGTFSMTLQAQ